MNQEKCNVLFHFIVMCSDTKVKFMVLLYVCTCSYQESQSLQRHMHTVVQYLSITSYGSVGKLFAQLQVRCAFCHMMKYFTDLF